MTDAMPDEKTRGDELRILYTSCVTEIASFKQQQWHITNYAILLYVAIAGMPRIPSSLNQIEYFVLFVAALAVLSAGWFVLGMLADSIQIRRGRQTECRKAFTAEFMHAWRCGKSESEVPDILKEKPNLLWLFRSILIVGFAATCWLLIRYACSA
jgi:hypothetical protein